jgi:hypothetical protein
MIDMNTSKADLTTDGSSIRFALPIAKVDAERRIVSGFATTDALDKQGDIVTQDASMKAFSKFNKNIREMHQPVAVGKMVAFKQDRYFDPESKKFYNGVYVSAYVSKGAQDTWEKVLDGTLSGFSIGGRMNKWDDAYDEKIDKTIRIIKDYDLVELSLVDNPANQFANILSVEKVDGVDMIKGEAIGVEIENVFWDKESGLVLVSDNEVEVSPVSGSPMENIGFVEKNDDEKTEMIKFLVDSAKGINTSKITKEVSPMTDTTENVTETAEVVEVAVEETEVAPEADTTAELNVEKSEEVDAEKSAATGGSATGSAELDDEDEEDMDDEDDAMKGSYKEKSDDVDSVEPIADKSEIVEEVSKSEDVVAGVVDAVSEIQNGLTSAFSDLSAVVKSLHDEIADLKKSLGMVNAKLTDAETDFNNIGKRMQAVEADTAFRKSGDLGEIVQEVQMQKSEQSLWGGRFLKTADLFR